MYGEGINTEGEILELGQKLELVENLDHGIAIMEKRLVKERSMQVNF